MIPMLTLSLSHWIMSPYMDSSIWVYYVGCMHFLVIGNRTSYFSWNTATVDFSSKCWLLCMEIYWHVYCFTVIIIYYIPCSSLHHSHHLASHLVWVPAPSHEGVRRKEEGAGHPDYFPSVPAFSPPSSSPLVPNPLAPFFIGALAAAGGRYSFAWDGYR